MEQYYFPNNDTIENIDAKKLQVAASAGWEIISTIISPDTKPFMEVSKPLYDNSIYQINSSTFLPMNVDKKTFEQESGIKLTQIPGDNNCVYQSQVYLFNIKKPVTLSVYSDDFYGIISNINAVISETDIAFNEIYNELAKEFGTPKVNGNIYEWYSAYGNIYKINLYDGYCTINVENYLNTPNEGYAIDNEKLVTLNDSNGIINILVSKRNDKISYEVSGSVRDENSTPSEKAVLVLEKLKDVLSYEELEKINFLNIGTDGIGGSETFRLSEYYNNIYDIETLNKDIELIEKELPGDFENVSLSYNIAGTHLYIDYIDLLHHQGDCYNIRDARTAFELARSMCTNGRDIPSVWAMDAVARSIKGNFLPSYMQTQYQKPITREDFCTIVYEWLKLKKVELEMYDAKTHFKDTENHSVNVLFELGIINGKDNELFGPTDQITREQAASILNRLLSLFENNMPTILYTFADDLSISNYARNSVYNMYEKNIMNGIGDELFAPQDTFTKEQAIVTLIRLNDYMS